MKIISKRGRAEQRVYDEQLIHHDEDKPPDEVWIELFDVFRKTTKDVDVDYYWIETD